jgi:7-carboxy-7-deazaguanine synthase
MGRVPPDLTGQLSLVGTTTDEAESDAAEGDAAPTVDRSPARRSRRREARPASADDTSDVADDEAPAAATAAAPGGAQPGPEDEASTTSDIPSTTEAPADGDDPTPEVQSQNAAAPSSGGDPVAEVPGTRVELASPVELVVSEVFGPTFQGEGPSLGRRAGFVRLGRCNLDCEWCDSAYTWDWSRFDSAAELRSLAIDDVVAQLDGMAPEVVVITGGEPLLQQRRLLPLLQACAERGWPVEVETNGTRSPDDVLVPLVAQWNVSPKLSNSGVAATRAIRPHALAAFQATGRAVFKFVVADEDDLDEIARLVKLHGLAPIWVMAEGTDPSTVLSRSRRLADAVLARGWNLTTRLHTLLWGDTRGR